MDSCDNRSRNTYSDGRDLDYIRVSVCMPDFI